MVNPDYHNIKSNRNCIRNLSMHYKHQTRSLSYKRHIASTGLLWDTKAFARPFRVPLFNWWNEIHRLFVHHTHERTNTNYKPWTYRNKTRVWDILTLITLYCLRPMCLDFEFISNFVHLLYSYINVRRVQMNIRLILRQLH